MADVLLVDDDGSVLLTLAIALRRHGHQVTVACDADGALQQLQVRRFDWIVSDVRMPGMSGVELAKLVASHGPLPRIALVSAYSHVCAPAGVDAFLQKPVDAERLHALLSSDAGESNPGTNGNGVVARPCRATPNNGATPNGHNGNAKDAIRPERTRSAPPPFFPGGFAAA